jgi:exosortase
MGFTYWGTMLRLERRWCTMPDYQHGFLVPLFAMFLLWVRQDMVRPWPNKGSWWALAFFALWALMRFVNNWLNYERDCDTIFPFLLGVALFLGGWKAFRWAWPSILFLEFMVPLPASIAVSLSQPLQRIATHSSTYCLQTLGISALPSSGTVIDLPAPAGQLDVDRACSGLAMLTLFFAICVGAAFLLRASWWEKLVIVVSAVPIAVFSNVARITITGLLKVMIHPVVGQYFHDYAGWLMMIIAMLMIWGEMALIAALFVEASMTGPLTLGSSRASRPAAGGSRGGSSILQFPVPPRPPTR